MSWKPYQEHGEIERNFNEQNLADYMGYAETDIETINEYLTAMSRQIARVRRTEFVPHIDVRRRDWEGVTFDVQVEHIPQVEGFLPTFRFPYSDHQRFGGLEKKEARAYIANLQAKHPGAEVTYQGFRDGKTL